MVPAASSQEHFILAPKLLVVYHVWLWKARGTRLRREISSTIAPGSDQVSSMKPAHAVSSPKYCGDVTNSKPPPRGILYRGCPLATTLPFGRSSRITCSLWRGRGWGCAGRGWGQGWGGLGHDHGWGYLWVVSKRGTHIGTCAEVGGSQQTTLLARP